MQVARRNPPTVLTETTVIQRVLGDMNLPAFQITDTDGTPLEISAVPSVTLNVDRLMPDPAEATIVGEVLNAELGWVGADWTEFFLQAGTYRLQYVVDDAYSHHVSPFIFVEVVDLGEHPISTLGEPADG